MNTFNLSNFRIELLGNLIKTNGNRAGTLWSFGKYSTPTAAGSQATNTIMSLSKTTLAVSLWYLNLVKREKSKDYEHEHARVFKSAERGVG